MERQIDINSISYIHTRQPTNPRPMPTKKLPALIEERIYPRSTPAVSALYP